MRRTHTAPDWALMIDHLVDTGLTHRQIGDATGAQLTKNMVRHYRAGVQPLYWRGEAMIVLWMQATGKLREEVPTQQVIAPYRVPQGARAPEVRINLPNWPPVPKPAVQPIKRRGKARVMGSP